MTPTTCAFCGWTLTGRTPPVEHNGRRYCDDDCYEDERDPTRGWDRLP